LWAILVFPGWVLVISIIILLGRSGRRTQDAVP
jgi:hypothetical protein